MNLTKSVNRSIAFLLFSLLIFSWLFDITYDVPRYLGAILGYIFIFLFYELFHFKLSDIGLSKKYLIPGLRLGLLFGGLALLGMSLLFLVSPEAFRDDRHNKGLIQIFYSVFIVLPFLTVLFEEILFRGVLLSLFLKKYSQVWSVVFSSVAFGFWHFLSAQNLNSAPKEAPGFLIVIVTIIFTAIGGMFLSWLRIRSKSLLAPIIFHWIINATGIIFAYLSWQN
jgi:membrane protease YdiL (CAAX protease family)